jgi:3-phenylpropionate/trans-cinnamate dioxygenase ferredoxin component
MSWVRLAGSSDLADGIPLGARHGDEFVVLVRSGDRLFALDDTCSHEECPLSDGTVTDAEIVCPCHGSVFDLRTGEALTGPALESVRTFAVREVDGEIEVELPA